MFFFIAAIGILTLAAAACGMSALLRPASPAFHLVPKFGSLAIAAGCAVGLASLCFGWNAQESCGMPWGLPFGSFRIGLDPLSRIFLIPVFGLGLVCAFSGRIAFRHEDSREHSLGIHWMFYALLILGMALVMTSRDLILFLISWEIMSVSPFFLIDFDDEKTAVRRASWIYLTAAHLGAVFLIAFFALLWQASGSTSFTDLSQFEPGPVLKMVLAALSLIGFGAKAGLFPMHVWLPEAHPAAPSHVSALLSGAMINAGLYGLLRSLDFLGASLPIWSGWILLGLGLTTALCGIFKASAQSNLKKMLAYSSVENMGIMLIGAACGLIGSLSGNISIAVLGMSASLFHMLNHAVFKGLLFLCAGEVLHAAGTVRMDLLGGLQKQMPLVSGLFLIGSMSIACLPPFNGFCGELVLALTMVQGSELPGVGQQIGLLGALIGVALVGGMAVVTFVKAYGSVFQGMPRSSFAENLEEHGGLLTVWPLLIPAALCVFGGLYAEAPFHLTKGAVMQLIPLGAAQLSEAESSLSVVSEALRYVSWFGVLLIAAVAVLSVVRWLLVRGRVQSGAVWGCGYQYGTSRIQYTDISFVNPASWVFSPLMGLKRKEHLAGREVLFPAGETCEIEAEDRLRMRLYAPLFERIADVAERLKILQHGRIHLYILYILATVVVLLIWGLHE